MFKLRPLLPVNNHVLQQLHALGIDSAETLLQNTRTEQQITAIAGTIGVTKRHVRGWIGRAELALIRGIGDDYVELLYAARIYNPQMLASQHQDELFESLHAANRRRRLVRRVPTAPQLAQWIGAAAGAS